MNTAQPTVKRYIAFISQTGFGREAPFEVDDDDLTKLNIPEGMRGLLYFEVLTAEVEHGDEKVLLRSAEVKKRYYQWGKEPDSRDLQRFWKQVPAPDGFPHKIWTRIAA